MRAVDDNPLLAGVREWALEWLLPPKN